MIAEGRGMIAAVGTFLTFFHPDREELPQTPRIPDSVRVSAYSDSGFGEKHMRSVMVAAVLAQLTLENEKQKV